jgi:hypothetical protein
VSAEKRWRFVKDNDGHSYCIPADAFEHFGRLLEGGESTEGEFIDAYDGYRTAYHPSQYTFTDPRGPKGKP